MSKGLVFKSRFTPGLFNAVDVGLQKGDTVTWRSQDGHTEQAVVETSLRQHSSGPYGYEVTFSNGKYAFVCETQIIGWEGKVE